MEERIQFSVNQHDSHEIDTSNFAILKNRISSRAFAKRNEALEEAKNNLPK